MSYRISILEFSKHNEIVWSFLKVILSQEAQVDVFLNEFVYHQLYDLHENPKIHWYIKPETQSSSEFITQHRAHLLTRDRLLFTSVPPKDLKMFEDQELARLSSLLIYDLNYYASEFHNINEGRNTLEVIKGQLLSERKYIRTAFKFVDQILVPSSKILDYAKQKNIQSIDGALNVLILGKLKKRKIKKTLRIVIPGSVSNSRKNYTAIFKALYDLNDSHLRQSIKVTFLGLTDEKPAGKMIQKLSDDMKDHIEIEHFTTFVPQRNFNKIMKKSNFLLLPIAEKKESGAVHELYGYSTVSGCIADMVKFGKPALIPEFYPLEDSLESVCKRYSSGEQLSELLKDWIFNKSFQQMSLEGFNEFLPEAQAEEFFKTLQPDNQSSRVLI